MAPPITLVPFVSLGTSGLEKAIKILSIFTYVVGGSLYTYLTSEAVGWSVIFPSPNELESSVWIMHLILRLLALWMPMALILVHYKINQKILCIIYLIGTALAPLLCIACIALIWPYQEDDYLRTQFIKLASADVDQAKFPTAMINTATTASKCCSWYGPTDFFETYERKQDVLDNNLEFMEKVAKCFGNIFTVTKSGNKLMYDTPKETEKFEEITGCAEKYEETAARLCNFIVFISIFICLLSPCFIVLYILNYRTMGDPQVAPTNQQVAPSDPDFQSSEKLEEVGSAT